MTQREMYNYFLAGIHNFDVDSEYEFQTHEVNIFLTKAYREVVDELYAGFEKSEKNRKLLNPLVRTGSSSTLTVSGVYSNAYSVDLSTITPRVLYVLSEEVQIGYSETVNRVPVKVITLDSYTANKENPFKKPYKKLVWRLDVGNGSLTHYIISTYTPTSYYITYLQQPEDIDVILATSILINEDVHKDIVDRAVQHALLAKQTNKNLKS